MAVERLAFWEYKACARILMWPIVLKGGLCYLEGVGHKGVGAYLCGPVFELLCGVFGLSRSLETVCYLFV